VREAYSELLMSGPSAETLAERFPIRVREKYEVYLSDELTARLFARERIDLHGARQLIARDCSVSDLGTRRA
jgi:hypothetical protein